MTPSVAQIIQHWIKGCVKNEYDRILNKAAMTLLEVHCGKLPGRGDKSPVKTQTIYLVSRSMVTCLVYSQVHQPFMWEVEPLLCNMLHHRVNIPVTFIKKVQLQLCFSSSVDITSSMRLYVYVFWIWQNISPLPPLAIVKAKKGS